MGELHKGEGLQEIANASQAQGTFSFDPDDLRSLIRQWKELSDNYRASVIKAESMAVITPPAYDMASTAYTNVAMASGASYIEYLKHNMRYCEVQARLFEAALNDYLGVEDTNTTEINSSSGEV